MEMIVTATKRESVNRTLAVTDRHVASFRFPADFAHWHNSENMSPMNAMGKQQKRAHIL